MRVLAIIVVIHNFKNSLSSLLSLVMIMIIKMTIIKTTIMIKILLLCPNWSI